MAKLFLKLEKYSFKQLKVAKISKITEFNYYCTCAIGGPEIFG